ncbi:MAG: chromosome segregation protein SMC [Candidatus Woesearchaeota archaeon]
MTKISKLEMQGFKSFAKKTELVFDDSFNCVIGPNGSGKSNILDAICFVLGKSSSKALRAEKSSNLIYNGGKSKNPSREGTVSLFLDNENKQFPVKENHVKITRTIKQSGQSKYSINDETSTRQQILDMLSRSSINPNGYNIILQGDVDRIVEISAEERRRVLEEVAGISIYEEKKQKAMNELDKVETSLNEVDIVMKEKDTYIQELKKDRDQALKYKELEKKLAQNKASHLNIQITRRKGEKDKKEEQTAKYQEEIDKLNEAIGGQRKTIEEKKKRLDEINEEIEEKGEKEQVELNKEVESLRINMARYRERIDSCKQQIAQIDSRRTQLKSNMSEIDSKIGGYLSEKEGLEKKKKELEANLQKVESHLATLREKNDVEGANEIEKQIEEIDKSIDDDQAKIHELREKQQGFFREKDKLEVQLENIDEAIDKVKSIEKEHKEELQKLKTKKEKFKGIVDELGKKLDDDSSYASQLSTARGRLQEKMESLSKLKAQNISITEALGASNAVTKILDQKQKFKAHGTVSDLGKVTSKYSLALEIAAGNKLKSIVVEDDKAASDCIKFLKSQKLGVASFLPLNKIRGVPKNPNADQFKRMKGVHGFASELVDHDSRFKDVFSYVFGNTLVVDDIAAARAIGVNKIRMVTLDGDLVEMSGAMHGGHRSRKSAGAGFKEKEVAEDIEKLEKETEDLQNVISTLEEQRKGTEERIAKLREDKAELEGEIMAAEKSLHLQSTDVGSSKEEKTKLLDRMEEIDKEIDKILEEISDVNRRLADNKSEKQKLKQKVSTLRDPKVLAELNTYDQKRQELKEELVKVDSRLESLENQISTIAGPEKERTDGILKQLEKEEREFNDEISNLEKKITDGEKELKTKEEQQAKFYKQFKGLFNEKTKANEEMQKAENEIANKNEKIREIERKINVANLELARINAELSGLEEEFNQYEGVELVDKTEEQLKKEIKDFEKMAESIGDVNMKALEAYERIKEEYDKMVEKKETLTKEKNDVLVMMNEIEAKKQELFMETYERISENFVRIFKELSTKGDAFLELENPKSVFEGGMRIKVRLTGKKFLDIRSLSGGEKTLTALAFIFAVLEYQPAPFYVLDEVDAALDKRNAEKLAELVRKYTGKAQYILISHNDGVISEADTLYGVTMNEHGMSKVVSLRV